MRTWQKMALGLFVIACLALAIWMGALIVGIINSPFTYKEMDFDNDGTVSLSEIKEALSVRHAEVSVAGQACTQYTAQKDGRSLKLACPKK